MMNDVLQTYKGNNQDRKGCPPTKQIAKEICEKEPHKTDIQSQNTDR